MVASLLRVLQSGIQDSRLLPPRGQPNISLFKTVLIRAGRFTTQWVRLDFDTKPNFGTKAVITLPRKGHMISRLFLVTTFPDLAPAQNAAAAAAQAQGKPFLGPAFIWTNSLGHSIVNLATLDIGGARVEQIDGRLLEILDEFYTPLEKVEIVNRLIQRNSTDFPNYVTANSAPVTYTPLTFWFSRGDPGVNLPIDALSVDQVKLTITFNPATNLYVSNAFSPPSNKQCNKSGGAYFPILGSEFYVADPLGKPVDGLPATPGGQGNPMVPVLASQIPGVKMPTDLSLGDTYILAEYIYLDAPEANRFRISDIEVPITQHYSFEPHDTSAAATAVISLAIPNPTRNIFFYAQRFEGDSYNAQHLATRDLSGSGTTVPWWPNASPISSRSPGLLQPAFVFRNSEPLKSIQLRYANSLMRYSTTSPSVFRSLFPSYEMKKSPYVNRYIYSLHFGMNHGHLCPSQPSGEANLDKIGSVDLELEFNPFSGSSNPNTVPRYIVRVWAETYNIFRVYGGRGGMLFAY